MSRWSDVITLLEVTEPWVDEEGAEHSGERRERTVFCNPGTLGVMTMAQLRSSEVRITNGEAGPEIGLREMSMVYIRQCDYRGEDRVIYHGLEMDVIALTSDRDNYKMIVRQRYVNV